ncbi:protease complex subunit PrcB family protein [Desulfuribacillus alkaliarsenatis]|uniref:PrcB C-terminal domain-containing protein n=1 Tax=Desulfuribacillus alkaliarsenatis TaxID=766136 RepID=A0A1E5G4X8_9FIRM|nr:protease complex subunit PrcB family protein [Desulfuribacillus alkaliarsenatis]OEF98155.1 hypothetical protein BHF68_00235 [Desulfuribacillus alkaliarsenatis]
MKIKRLLQVLLAVSLLFVFTACDDAVAPNENGEKPAEGGVEVEYQVITEQELPAELMDWYLENYQNEGLHMIVLEDTQYIIVSAGERPTGGYQIINLSLKKLDEKIYVTGEVQPPAEGDMVIQALTYPNVLLTRAADDSQFVYSGLTQLEPEAAEPYEASEGSAYGIFTGMIDQNSIEIQLTPEEHRAFQLTDEAKEQLVGIEEGDHIYIEFEPIEGQQNRISYIEKMSLLEQ